MAPPPTRFSRLRSRLLSSVIAVATVALVAAVVAPGMAPRAEAAAGDVVIQAGQLAVTFVARSCPEYTDIMANRARNNIQESLRDLGKDTVYSAGQPISPAIEEPNQPNCKPLTGWNFQLGTGITGKTAAAQNLSRVTGAYPTSITTGGATAELDPDGVDTGRMIDGAVTVVLTPEQAARAQRGGSLWTQGGVGAQTLPPGGQYGFGALRCSVDNLNGDNVEFISYPQSARHVFCYYFAVTPPPIAGTIIVKKELAPGNIGTQRFDFEGNISYDRPSEDDPGRFSLTASQAASGQVTFIRGEVDGDAPPWNFRELVPEGWSISATTPPSCTSPLKSPWKYDEVTTRIDVTLIAKDVVTCTYTNTRDLTGDLTLYKETVGRGGTFPFVITPPAPAEPITPTVVVPEPGVPVEVAESVFRLPGTYTATETLPVVNYGTWEVVDAVCSDGKTTVDVPVTAVGQERTARQSVAAGQGVNCLFVNGFTSNGRIDIEKTSLNGVGTFNYFITPVDPDDVVNYQAAATTTAPDSPVLAAPSAGSAPATQLPIDSQWEVQELLPAPTAAGFWRIVSADCGDSEIRGVDLEAATVDVEITEDLPQVLCSFANEFVSDATLEVIKNTSDDTTLRPDDAVVAWSCDDESAGDVTVAPGEASNTTGAVTTTGYRTCTVEETATGAASEVGVETSATITVNGLGEPYTLGSEFLIEPEDAVIVTVDNVLTAPAPTPTPTPTPPTPVPPTPDPTPPPLPPTGLGYDAAPIVWTAAAGIAAGLALLLGARLRRRR